MILTYEQLMQTNLKGYKYSETSEGYTMTGWGTIDEYYVVLDDDGETCVVAQRDYHKRTRTLTKEQAARKVAKQPSLVWSEEKQMTVNAIEKL